MLNTRGNDGLAIDHGNEDERYSLGLHDESDSSEDEININPESLKPKLPSRKDLNSYPVKCYLEYRGHKDAVPSVSTEISGQWIASGSLDVTVRIWEVETGRCLKLWWEVREAVKYVAVMLRYESSKASNYIIVKVNFTRKLQGSMTEEGHNKLV